VVNNLVKERTQQLTEEKLKLQSELETTSEELLQTKNSAIQLEHQLYQQLELVQNLTKEKIQLVNDLDQRIEKFNQESAEIIAKLEDRDAAGVIQQLFF